MPESVSLSFARPAGFDHLSEREFADRIVERVAQVESRMAAERDQTGHPVFGRRAILRQNWRDRPDTSEPRRALNPRVAARSKWSRIEALMRNASFRAAYLAARDSFVSGIRDVIFPAGTYWLRRFASALCGPAPAPA